MQNTPGSIHEAQVCWASSYLALLSLLQAEYKNIACVIRDWRAYHCSPLPVCWSNTPAADAEYVATKSISLARQWGIPIIHLSPPGATSAWLRSPDTEPDILVIVILAQIFKTWATRHFSATIRVYSFRQSVWCSFRRWRSYSIVSIHTLDQIW